jgi:hypothetical protein
MKRLGWLLVLAVAPGCVGPGRLSNDPRKQPVPVEAPAPPLPPPVVLEEVTEQNAWQVRQRLAQEIEREANPPPAPVPLSEPKR